MRLFRRFRPEENPFLVVRCKGGEGTVFLSCDRGKIVLCELLCVLLRDVAGKGNDEIVRRVEGFFMLLEIFSMVSLSGICEVTADTFSFLMAS